MGQTALKVLEKAELQDSTLVVAWTQDSGSTGQGTADFIIRQTGCRAFAEIEPEDFFPLSGVSIEGDVARFPESRFYQCPSRNLALLKSDAPAWEWHQFLNMVLDVAEQHCRVRQVLTVGGIVSFSPHTLPRQMIAVTNSPEMSRNLGRWDITGLDHETQPGQRPTMSSYLLWLAQKRGIAAASLWLAVPFYLAASEDPRSWMRYIHFLDDTIGLGADTADLAGRAEALDRTVGEVTARDPHLGEYVRKLESNVTLTQEESEKLARAVGEALRRRT